MGAHSIGTARRGNSGFDGRNGWVNNPRQFSNGYYDLLVGGSVDPDNFFDLIHAPQWTQELISNTNRGTPSRIQWFHQKQVCGGAANCTNPEEDVSRNMELSLLFLVHLYVHKLTLIASLTGSPVGKDHHDQLRHCFGTRSVCSL